MKRIGAAVKSPAALALAVALVLRATPAAAADTRCQAASRAAASRVQRTADAFSKELSPSGKSLGPTSATQAVLYSAAAAACLIAAMTASVESGVTPSLAATERAACLAAGLAADLAGAGSSQRLGSIEPPTEKATVAAARASLLLAIFISQRVPEPLRRTASDLQASLQEAENVLRTCGAELANPSPVKRFEAASFDGYVGSSFAIHLDSGKATVTSAEAILEGSVTISPKSDPSLKLSVSGRVVLKVRPASYSSAGPPGPGESASDRTALQGTDRNSFQKARAWASLEGQGSARVTGFGPAVTIPNVALQSQANAVMFTGGEAAFRGCTHTLAGGSGFTTSQVLLEGSLKCGPWSLTASSTGIDKTSVAGGGTLTAWNKRFTMTYSASGDGLVARGSLSGPDTPWTRLPGFEAEYRIEAPKIEVRLDGPTLSPAFGAGRVNVRTTARKPDGNPWSSASLTPDVMVISAPPADAVPVPFPVLPAPPDVEKAARDACEAGARRTLAGKALQAALDVCRSGHPSPPSVPTLPRSVSLKVGDVLR